MTATEKEYLSLPVVWESETQPPKGAEIEEEMFELIIRLKEEEDV